MKFILEIDGLGNAAFHEPDCDQPNAPHCCPGWTAEVPKVLQRAAGKVESAIGSGLLLDTNGNHVGQYRFEEA